MTALRFGLHGTIAPLAKAADPSGYLPSRPLGGWLAPYAKIGHDGSLIASKDREGHIFEAARTIGQIDFTEYLRKGRWNDTHIKPKVWVGVPTVLEHHNELSELAKAHKVVGWWTEGHLFDRNDPRSWALFTDYEPTTQDLDRADHFWNLATMLKGLPRSLAFSAEGKMALSPCGSRIIFAQVSDSAVCETPQIPEAAAHVLTLAKARGEPLELPLDVGMVRALPCDSCRCPAGARCRTIEKAVTASAVATLVPEDLEGNAASRKSVSGDNGVEEVERLIRAVVAWSNCTEAQARRWTRKFLAKRKNRNQRAA